MACTSSELRPALTALSLSAAVEWMSDEASLGTFAMALSQSTALLNKELRKRMRVELDIPRMNARCGELLQKQVYVYKYIEKCSNTKPPFLFFLAWPKQEWLSGRAKLSWHMISKDVWSVLVTHEVPFFWTRSG